MIQTDAYGYINIISETCLFPWTWERRAAVAYWTTVDDKPFIVSITPSTIGIDTLQHGTPTQKGVRLS